MIDRELAQDLRSILGDKGISTSPAQLIAYASDMWPKYQIYKLMGRFGEHPPDAVVWPADPDQVIEVVKLLNSRGIPVIAAGGLSGVCGGTVPVNGGIILDMKRMNRVLNLDSGSSVVEVESGILGQVLEEWLNERGYTLGHFPSSIASSTVGGYAATRSAGQFSSKYGKFEDMVIGATFVTADGKCLDIDMQPGESDRLNPLHILVGSEGTMGVFVRLRLKLWVQPQHRIFAGFRFKSIKSGLETMRNIMQSGLQPSLLRLYDPLDALVNRLSETHGKNEEEEWYGHALSVLTDNLMGSAYNTVMAKPWLLTSALDILPMPVLMVLGYEGESRRNTGSMDKSMLIAHKNHGHYLGPAPGERWYEDRYKVSFKQSRVFQNRGFVDTIEVSAPWNHIMNVYEAVRNRVSRKVVLMAHFSHAYRDGCSVYLTFSGLKSDTSRLMDLYQSTDWEILQTAVNNGATVSHHHGIGLMKRDFSSLEYQSGEKIFSALKAAIDPQNTMNPGKVYASKPKELTTDPPDSDTPSSLTDFMAAASYLFRTAPPNTISVNVPEVISSLLRFAARHQVGVTVQSGHSPKQARLMGNVYIDMSDMDEILGLDPLSGIVTTQAGTSVDNIEAFLHQKGYTLGWYPANKGKMPIGTYVATGGAGLFSPLYGGMRDQVTGLSAVLSNGSVFRARPAPRRSVGPDMIGLFVGSQGRFGVITGLCLRIFELPKARQTFVFTGDDPTIAISAFNAALSRGVRPVNSFVVVRSPDRILGEGRVRMIVRLAGKIPDVGQQAGILVSVMEGAGFQSSRVRKTVKDWLHTGKIVFQQYMELSRLLNFCESLPMSPDSGFPDVYITGISKHAGKAYVIIRNPSHSLSQEFVQQWQDKSEDIDNIEKEWIAQMDPAEILNRNKNA